MGFKLRQDRIVCDGLRCVSGYYCRDEDADIAKVSAFVKDMVGIGVLVPDDGLEDYIRQIGNLPERTDDTRELSQTREEQQGQNEPPEPETAAGKEPKEDDEEISEEVVEAAKKRLGRV